jgi:hypothetical protein
MPPQTPRGCTDARDICTDIHTHGCMRHVYGIHFHIQAPPGPHVPTRPHKEGGIAHAHIHPSSCLTVACKVYIRVPLPGPLKEGCWLSVPLSLSRVSPSSHSHTPTLPNCHIAPFFTPLPHLAADPLPPALHAPMDICIHTYHGYTQLVSSMHCPFALPCPLSPPHPSLSLHGRAIPSLFL